MIKRLVDFFSSLRLTVVLLSFALLLVFIGTLAQVKLGLYIAQAEYFRSVFVYFHPEGASWKIPVFPGGWLLGGFLLVNLIAAHIKRFKFTRKKLGIFFIHAGLILLLLGQFFTELFQVESNIRLEEGETKNYSEDSKRCELAVVDVSNADHDQVFSIPETLLANGGEIRDARLPFVVRVKNYFKNSQQAGPVSPSKGEKIQAVGEDGKPLWFSEEPLVTNMDLRNVPAALVEFSSDKGVIGQRIASLWIDEPQTFEIGGRTYQFAMRPTRYYRPYTLTLIDFRHDVYQGTGIPKNFSSKIHLSDPKRGEERDVLIKMNDPLRYAGETFFQASFDPKNDKVTILQVVRNPAAATPYISCVLVGLGLLTQFLMHLVGFARKTKAQPQPIAAQKIKPSAAAVAGGKTL